MRTNTPSPAARLLAALTSFMLAALFVGLFAGFSRAADLNVGVDQARLVRLEKPGVEVIIGNPSIADVSVQSGRALVLTGKSAGLTNLIVLDGAGQTVLDRKVFVSHDAARLVTVNKGAARETHSCSPACGPALMPGDAITFFDPLAKEIRNKLGLSQSAVEGTTTQQ